MFGRLLIYYSPGPFSCSLCGGKSSLRVICFCKWNDLLLNYQQFHGSVLQKCLGRFCFPPKVFTFFRPSKMTLSSHKGHPQWKGLGAITTRVPHLHRAAVVACRPHSLSASSLTSGCRDWSVQGSLSFVCCISKPEPGLRPGRTHRAPRGSQLSCLGSCQGSPLGPAFPACLHPQSLLSLFCSKLIHAYGFAPFFSCLKRLQFYWSVILHPGWKEMITKCFWSPNLFLRGTNLSKSNLIVVFILTLSSRTRVIAELFRIEKPAPRCHSHVSGHGQQWVRFWLSRGSVGPEHTLCACFVLLSWL